MSLIIIKNKDVLELNSLHNFVLRFIWEREKMSGDEIRLMQQSIINYKQHCDLTGDEELLYVISQMAVALKQAEEGKYEARKAIYREHGVDWRKVCNVPGAHTQKDLIIAQRNYERYKRENPDTEQTPQPN